MASEPETFVLTAECLCKAHNFSTKVPASSLPLPAYACHCNSCRHSTGALYSIDSPWPEPRENVDVSKLKKYEFSANISILFCGTCSTPLFFESAKTPHDLGVFTGALKNHDFDVVRIADHIFVGDTIDGGASMWLQNPNADGSQARRFKERSTGDNSEEHPHNWPPTSTSSGYEKKTENASIPIRCHCKGIDLLLHRGNYDGKTKEELPWFIDPNTQKNLATFDVCDSCRLQSGIDIFHWTYTELTNITFSSATRAEGKAFPKTTSELKAAVDGQDPAMGTLGYYKSSPDVQRYFCKVCSATAFYAVDERPEFVDVPVGLLDSADGARAEDFLSWSFGGTLTWVKDTEGGWREKLTKQVQKEAEEWRVQRGYPKNWRRIDKEKETQS